MSQPEESIKSCDSQTEKSSDSQTEKSSDNQTEKINDSQTETSSYSQTERIGESQTETSSDSQTGKLELKPIDKISYQIRSKTPLIKSTCFYLMKEDKIIYMAILKFDKIIFKEGEGLQNKKKNGKTAEIIRSVHGYNIIKTDDHDLKVKYTKNGQKFPMVATFTYNGHRIRWNPKDAEYNEFLKDGSKNKPRRSNKNFMLQNSYNHPTFILRKMSKQYYDVECFPTVDPLIVFSIALSGIIGPIAI